MKIEDYLKTQALGANIDFRLRVCLFDGVPQIYIHPFNTTGVTVDYRVQGNELIPIENANDPKSPIVVGEGEI